MQGLPASNKAGRGTVIAVGVVTVVFTDLVGSTAQLVRLGHDDSERLRRENFRIVRDAAVPRGGREVKSTGDGLMVVFDSPLAAVEMAITVQRHGATQPWRDR